MDCLLIGEVSAASGGQELFDNLAAPVQVALLVGSMSFLVGMLVCMTAFTRIIIVLSFVRRALSTNEIPPNQVLLGLSLFLTFFVMGPTVGSIYDNALQPLISQDESTETRLTTVEAVQTALDELKVFMLDHTRTDDLALFFDLAEQEPPSTRVESPLQIVVPAFIISELKTAFIMGFCIYIPFLLIDLVVSTILMALGMMMMPPVVVSTPCKLLLFVLVDGWQLLTRALVASFAVN